MKQLILTQFPWPTLPTIALLIFFIFFVGMIIRIFGKSYAQTLSAVELQPLNDGERHE